MDNNFLITTFQQILKVLPTTLALFALSVPIGAVFDDGNRTGVWILDRDATTVRFAPVKINRLGEETAVVSGIEVGQPIVALGAHLLKEGASVRTAAQAEASNK